jgi:hypothetical protein
MNRRIKELQSQAYPLCRNYENNVIRTDDFIEKFAELIVKECEEICARTAELEGSMFEGAVACREAIQKHFGEDYENQDK